MPVLDPSTGDPSDLCAPWATIEDMPCSLAGDPERDIEAIGTDQATDALWRASEILYALSGSRWTGECTTVVRPCATPRPSAAMRTWWPGTTAWDIGSCTCNRAIRCGCNLIEGVPLAPSVVAVEQVTVDGVVLDPAEYEIIRGLLVSLTGDRWPCCQRLDLEATEPGTFSIRVRFGDAPPRGGRAAAAALACELLRAGQPGCRLPKRVQSVSRQGVSVTLLDPLTMFADGQTGLEEVDLWLGSLVAAAKRRPARIVPPGSTLGKRGR